MPPQLHQEFVRKSFRNIQFSWYKITIRIKLSFLVEIFYTFRCYTWDISLKTLITFGLNLVGSLDDK
jgi:hypothetical protein